MPAKPAPAAVVPPLPPESIDFNALDQACAGGLTDDAILAACIVVEVPEAPAEPKAPAPEPDPA